MLIINTDKFGIIAKCMAGMLIVSGIVMSYGHMASPYSAFSVFFIAGILFFFLSGIGILMDCSWGYRLVYAALLFSFISCLPFVPFLFDILGFLGIEGPLLFIFMLLANISITAYLAWYSRRRSQNISGMMVADGGCLKPGNIAKPWKLKVSIIVFTFLPVTCFFLFAAVPQETIHNFPFIEMINFYIFIALWASVIISISIAVVNWRLLSIWFKILPFIPLSLLIAYLGIESLFVPKLDIELTYVGDLEEMIYELDMGDMVSGSSLKRFKTECYEEINPSKYISISCKKELGGKIIMEKRFEMSGKIPKIGHDRIAKITVSDTDINCVVEAK